MKDLSKLQEKIGVKFNKEETLQQALVHRSFINENPDFGLDHNERLEFLGDAVLELVVTEHLYTNYPNPEGELTTWRAALVNAKKMAEVAEDLGLNDFMMLSRGEAKDNGRARQYILANTFEAFIGSLYLDQGYQICQNFIEKHLIKALPRIIETGLFKDAKSRFQEEAQERMSITPVYRVLEEWGPDHIKHFVIGVFLADDLIAKGEGSSKQEAEEKAAKQALIIKNW